MFRGIGPKLYAVSGLVVLLTLLSSGVGVYYFELSGGLSDGLARGTFSTICVSVRLRRSGFAVLIPAGMKKGGSVDPPVGAS